MTANERLDLIDEVAAREGITRAAAAFKVDFASTIAKEAQRTAATGESQNVGVASERSDS